MDITKNAATAALADDMIGAAQILEREAKHLKDCARTIRATGLYTWDYDPIENQRMHKTADIEAAARLAVKKFQEKWL